MNTDPSHRIRFYIQLFVSGSDVVAYLICQMYVGRLTYLNDTSNMASLEKPILVLIDDDEDDTYLIGSVIRRDFARLEFIAMTDSLTALEELKGLKNVPLLILLDLHMPIKSGLEVLAELRSCPTYEQLPVAIISSSIDPEAKRQLKPLSVLAYFEKPTSLLETSFELERLLKQVTALTYVLPF